MIPQTREPLAVNTDKPWRPVDIVEAKAARTVAQGIVDTTREPLLVLDRSLHLIAASRAFCSTFKLDIDDILGKPIYELGNGEWNIPQLRLLLGQILPEQGAMDNYEVEHDFRSIGRRTMLLNAREVYYEGTSPATIFLSIEDVTNKRRLERENTELLRQKDTLLDEIYHRVANSLQIIASILLIKARTVQSEETRLQLEDAHQRVLSVAAVQKHLHDTGAGKQVDIPNYLSRLCETLAQSMIGDSRPITLKVAADAGSVVSHQAVSLGLIVTELVMNALKHAFPGVKPDAAILVTYKVAGTDWKLTISDNGMGKSEPSTNQKKGGLGTSLVQALAKQLDAQVDIASDSHGTAVSITHATFKSKPPKPEESLQRILSAGATPAKVH